MLRTELRRGIGPWSGAAVAVTVLVALYGKAPGWQGRWSDATDMLHTAAGLLAGPLAAAAGCWQGGRERRRSTGELLASAPRGRLARTLVAAAPAALWPAAGLLLAVAVCLGATWPYAGGGRPFVSVTAADAVAVAALGTLGFVAGRLVPWRLTPPLVAAATYVGLGLPSYTASPARWLSPAADRSTAWQEPLWWFAPAMTVWTGGLALAALLAYGARRRALALVPLAAACAVAVPVVRLDGSAGPWRPDPDAARLVCDDGTPRVCLSAVDRALLPEASRALAGLNARLRGVPGAPARWVSGPHEPGPGEAPLPDPVAAAAHGVLQDPRQYAHDAASGLFDGACLSGEDGIVLDLAVQEWLAPAPPGSGVDPAALQPFLDRLRAGSPAQQRAFLGRYLTTDLCEAAEVPLP
ncbi:hypothetical protein [Streptomyces sp. NRRL S-118]|uniref:hypothetical protein n=1 Tax=Streptomyces sp. NRRL S-118 TaxID=1463881 RepID=UPI000693439E|nr:hypothetical protein [Streptomyces sp. NRRL S-118]